MISSSTGEYPGTFENVAKPSSHDTTGVVSSPQSWTRFTILMVAFSEGLTHLATLAIIYLFKDDLGLSPSQVSLLFIVPAFPWFLKPFFAFYSDSTTIWNMRRKPYLMIFSTLQAAGFVMLAYGTAGVVGAVLSLLLIGFSASFCSAIAEALLVEMTEGEQVNAAATISEYSMFKAVGSFLVAYLSGYFLETFTKKTIFLMTAVFPMLITIASSLMVDRSIIPKRTATEQIMALLKFLGQKVIWGPAIFILAFMCGPDYDDALFFYYTNVLGFTPGFMGTLRFTYSIAAFVGLLLYRGYLHSISYRRLLWMTILISLPIYLSPIMIVTGLNLKLGISDKVFVLSGGFLNEAVAEIQLMPLLVIAACVAPPGLEGSAYSAMFAVRNLGSAVSKATSAITMTCLGITAVKFDHLSTFILICGLFNLAPLCLMQLIPSERSITQSIKSKEDVASEAENVDSKASKIYPPLL